MAHNSSVVMAGMTWRDWHRRRATMTTTKTHTGVPWDGRTAYERWVEDDLGLDLHRGYSASALKKVPVKPWPERNILAAVLRHHRRGIAGRHVCGRDRARAVEQASAPALRRGDLRDGGARSARPWTPGRDRSRSNGDRAACSRCRSITATSSITVQERSRRVSSASTPSRSSTISFATRNSCSAATGTSTASTKIPTSPTACSTSRTRRTRAPPSIFTRPHSYPTS